MPFTARTLLREYWMLAAFVCAALAFASGMRGAGLVFVVFLGPAACLWAVVALIQALARPATRPKLAVLAVGLAITAGAVYCIINYRIRTDSVQAQHLAQAVVEYRNRVGVFPATLAETNVNLSGPAARVGARYRPDASDPLLDYGDAWDLWKRHRYDFKAGKWTVIVND